MSVQLVLPEDAVAPSRDTRNRNADPGASSKRIAPKEEDAGLCVHCGYVVVRVLIPILGRPTSVWYHLYEPGCVYTRTIECTPWRSLMYSQPDFDWPAPTPPYRGGWRPASFPRLTWAQRRP